ncbi:MAG: carboxypeptidase regulatory-like domain-containing protein [Acidobacteria bacterium]|nr:carboxypeptidase regulatory-like domain-containing protein [Acidobacteriota bacterium]
MMWNLAVRFALVVIAAAVPGMLRAQSFTATLAGTVTDQSGAVIPAAEVTATNLGTNFTATGMTDQQGRYVIPSLTPGAYSVAVQATGFKQSVRTGIRLEVDQRLRVDFGLELGAVSEKVEVSAAAATVQAETSSLGSVVNNRHLLNVPLNSRNAVSLMALIPGARPNRGFGDAFNSTTNFIINGGRGNSSEILTDGIANTTGANNPFNALPVAPPVEAVQEFKVQTNSLSAEYGRTGGGVLNFILKSGTNEIHWTLFEFLRNSALDANNFFNNQGGIPLTSFRRNQFGGVVGGPVVIPKWIDGRNKLFFFVSYEGLRQSQQASSIFTFPTAAERRGDFSQTSRVIGVACRPVAIFDPFSTTPTPGGGFVRTQFPNNVIPASRIDPSGASAVSYYPMPRSAGDACTGANNYGASSASRNNVDQVDFRVDYNPSERNRFFLRGSPGRRVREFTPEYYNTIGSPNRFRLGHPFDGTGTSLSYTRAVSPTLLAEVRFGLSRYLEGGPSPVGETFDMRAALGFKGSFVDQMVKPLSFPRIIVSGYGQLGTGDFAFTNASAASYQWLGNVTKITGGHTIKAGVDFRTLQSYGPNPVSTSGDFSFTPSFTQGPNPTTAGAAVGNGLASLLAGLGTGNVQITPRVATSNNYFALFIQDEWKVTRKLTLNSGLRYDIENGRQDRYDHLSWFNFTVRSPLADLVPLLPNLRGGLEFPNVGGNPRRQFDTDWNNFGPRFGLAYAVNSKTVLRSGYSLYYEPYTGRAVSTGAGFTGFSALTSWVSSLDGVTPLNVFNNSFPSGLNQPLGASLGLLTSVGEALGATARDGAFDRRALTGYIQHWNFGIERALPWAVVINAAYTGSKGAKLIDGGGWDENQLSPEALRLGNALLDRVPNPFFGIIQTGPLAASTTTRGQLLRAYPQFTNLLNFRPQAAKSNYHAFQLEANKRFSSGMQFVVAYTNGKLIDDSSNVFEGFGAGRHQNTFDRNADRAVSLTDVSQRLVVSYVVDLPFGRGRAFGSNWGRVSGLVFGGWQVNGIHTFQSGFPVPVANQSNNSFSFSIVQRPNVNGDPKLSADRLTAEKLQRWFNPSVFSQPQPYTLGNAPRVLPNVRIDGTANFDISLFKNFPVTERGTLQFRAEFFNAFNTPDFGMPGTNFGGANFGQVTAQGNVPRQVQFGLKLIF